MVRTVYHVVPNQGAWQLKQASVVLSNHTTKPPAVGAGQARARANQPSQLIVNKADGAYEYEYTYGDDPYAPKGWFQF